ncbi:MAG TPA: flagellar type III secretion system pore protein FliP [Bryobacteraceae bacterium]|nr:flagellar type III secretion system pore protein FliP [Bryobacteraceae bacterium]
MDWQNLSTPLRIVLVLSAAAMLPAAIMCVTPFLRIVIVLHFLRQALGTQTAPSNQVLVGLALFLTMGIMRPAMSRIYDEAWVPHDRGQITGAQAWEKARPVIHRHLLRFAREKDLALMLEVGHKARPRNSSEIELDTLVPAYVLSELRTSFQIGAALFLPFLVIDLIIASVTLALGMVQLPPAMISAPFKILLFVLVDGWNLVIGSLLKSFGPGG